jgi:hypothetical protein
MVTQSEFMRGKCQCCGKSTLTLYKITAYFPGHYEPDYTSRKFPPPKKWVEGSEKPAFVCSECKP